MKCLGMTWDEKLAFKQHRLCWLSSQLEALVNEMLALIYSCSGANFYYLSC